jgi:hypothetical protein
MYQLQHLLVIHSWVHFPRLGHVNFSIAVPAVTARRTRITAAIQLLTKMASKSTLHVCATPLTT